MDKAMGRDGLDFSALTTARTRLPRTASCDSVAYAEGVQKRKPFLFLSFSYFSDKRKVLCAYCYFSDRRKVHYAFSALLIMQKYVDHKVTISVCLSTEQGERLFATPPLGFCYYSFHQASVSRIFSFSVRTSSAMMARRSSLSLSISWSSQSFFL